MNNNEINFDPMTGQPIQRPNVNPNIQAQVNQQVLPQQNQQVAQNIQQNTTPLQNIPTVEQSKEKFIDNTQAINAEKKSDKKASINYAFIIILFIVILAVIYFVFPMLIDYI